MKSTILNFAILMMAVFAVVACNNESADNTDSTTEAVDDVNNTTPNVSIQNPNDAAPASEEPVGPTTTVEFETQTHDFGTVPEGEKVQYVYKFKNTGNEPLVISNAKGSCGCTVPSWPREPIPVGGDGEILVEFDTKGKGKVGGQKQTKRVTVTANTNPANSYLTITGTVTKEDTES